MQSKRTNARRINAEVVQFYRKSCYVGLANIFYVSEIRRMLTEEEEKNELT